ncbi:MAG: hypothetical protein HKN74_01305 [Acidimicrobiia bacterium]|nr:type II secretion system F family protein [Acidimicrobiia bacterium]NNF08901.1 hypothetical protein [Acidimicrobiia bacterium]NNL71247.1 hypothetical protein [Acidimicrobiia bacterium]
MSLVGALLIGAALSVVRRRRPGTAEAALAGALAFPVAALVGAAGGGALVVRRRLRARRLEAEAAAADVVTLAELTGLALSAGLSLTAALSRAADSVHPDLAGEVRGVLRSAVRGGLEAALSSGAGRGRRFYLMVARAATTGAPLVPAIDAFVRDATAAQRAARLEAARRLPVKLMIPLAFLILPGFVLLTVGPAVLAALERLALPL